MSPTQHANGYENGYPDPQDMDTTATTNNKLPPPAKTDGDDFPTYQLTILAICRFSEPIAFNSILAYTYIMVQDLNGGDDTNASFYAGLLVSAYAVAEAMTSMIWGAISDRYGRKPVVLFGLCGVAISSLIFGLAKHYWVALLARFVGGALNGNVSVMQTMMAEMVKRPEHEPKAYAVQPFVWFLGSIIGSAMGGFLAQPARFYPHIFPQDGLFGRYPYLLPNLVAVAVIVIAIIQGIILLEETNPLFIMKENQESQQPQPGQSNEDDDENTPLMRTVSHPVSIVESIRHREHLFEEDGLPTATNQRFDLRHNSFGTINSIKVGPHHHEGERSTSRVRPQLSARQLSRIEEPASASASASASSSSIKKRTFNFTVVMLIISLVLAGFHQMAFGAILPIYLLDEPFNANSGTVSASTHHLDLIGGMGFTLHDVGTYLAVNGFIALAIQGLIFPTFVEKMGVWLSFVVPLVLYPICYFIMPFLSLLRDDDPAAEADWGLTLGIYASLFLQNFFGIISVPCALILLKNATPSPLVLGRVNGLAMSAVCLSRTLSSPLVGVVYDFGGSAAAWGTCAAVAVLGAVQLWWVPRGDKSAVEEVHVESAFVSHENAIEDDDE